MEKQALQQLNQAVIAILKTARTHVLSAMGQTLTVAEKTSRKDLVTNVDRSNENFLVQQIRQLDPQAQILAEEGLGDQVTSMAGHVWIVDPIDGTMNFVHQRNHFAMMIGFYNDGIPTLGYIYDVMADKLYAGGPTLGVMLNDQLLPKPADTPLSGGLFGASGPLLIQDRYHMQTIAQESLGPRILGSAGVQISQVLAGELVGYLSYLRPWDFAAGRVLAESLGLVVSQVDGTPVNMLSSGAVLVATKSAQRAILTIVK
ncbi:inositol monophosphatase family protein [Lactiplantibacillus mudanjiangensis]|uniref:Fructose 1,6-bisphosphatase [Lactobacillus sp.] n=1 Tax=Lactiplantibacillus mudanjiangensis TaxID=1296538 RepID=A0A660EAP9_9LACO|nr:inositol monophosphatase family protein [Lactiplantibacillus mudanjiangensis]VDG20733.1 fructose 1,6-bisphosphatase [Lactobacillus sp.] [Lactiplantibacillus mudanjiangensis]VDG23875.1 fructose 1,6-bisphosphatase [Lactobacillus sp.] [Lactiplantibacillus mudanjiangensis]VDG30103.1 fructose 1,6-bisphosphatase [Lactobacillus sp.] [Lactiplantibacillus mudanjiangensis]VDG30589.1 fructose 1,6-bisphosphatase [Lactobacillus sp.] [Lactiplantibacillus mudanjiangensis]